jgi:xylulose-5-phosphate/fructose-6-phosphate phosphoketolase
MNKKADIVRIYLPPDVNSLLAVAEHCLKSRNYVNVIVAGKQPELQWMSFEEASIHCRAGLGIFPWASHEDRGEPDVVMACAGDVPTLETLAAVDLLRQYCPELKVRTVNVVDLMALQPQSLHPHGVCDELYYKIFPSNTQVIFAFHGYPSVIHKLTYRRTNYPYMHVHGYKEEGTTTTPFDMVVLNELDRFHLVLAVLDRIPHRIKETHIVRQMMEDKLSSHTEYVRKYGKDMDEILSWRWTR